MIKFKTSNPDLIHKLGDGTDEEGLPQEYMTYKYFPQNYAKYHIHKNTAEPRHARAHDRVHASDLDPARKWCPREPALLTIHNLKRKADFLPTAQRIVFDFGYAGADIIMRRVPEKMIWGNWKCGACDHFTKHSYKPQKCAKCNAHKRVIRYNEVLLQDKELGIVGSVDLMLDLLGNGKVTPIEIKTEGTVSFKARTKAFFDHEWRTMMYLYLASKTPDLPKGKVNIKEGRVLYLCKEGYAADDQIKEWKLQDWAKSPIKEYFVQRNDDMLANALGIAEDYRVWRKAYDSKNPEQVPILPPRTCDNAIETKAKNCTVCKQCFADGMPA